MRKSTKEKLIKSSMHSGVFTAQDVEREGLSKRLLYYLIESGQIVCISRGIFQLVGSEYTQSVTPDYAAIKTRVPNGVICLISALYHHNLSTEIPHKINIAISRNRSTPKIDYPPVCIYRMSEKSFKAGVEQMEIGGVDINIFSPEKTIADCFKYRHKIGTDLAVEGLKNYLNGNGTNPSKIMEMAKQCRVEKVMKPYIEAII